MATVLITGADRGIGAALARQYQERGDTAIAACLGDGAELAGSGIRVEPNVDVTKVESLRASRERLGDIRVDILISNAGAYLADSFGEIDYAAMQRLYDINTLGPLRVAECFAPLMGKGGKIGILTSRVGSIGDNGSGGMYAYRLSKCAANQLGVNLHHDLKPRGIAVMLLHPGQVWTAMTQGAGTFSGFISPEESASGLIRQLDMLDENTPPEFRHADGTLLPW